MKANKCWITIAFALVLVIASCAPTPAPTAAPSPAAAPTAAAPATFNWKARQGETIRVLLWNHPEVDYWEKNIQEFKDLTGININFEKLSVAEQYPKTLLELTTAPDKVDVFSIVPPQQAYKFTKEGFMEDLNLFINDSTLTSPEYYFSDFLEGTRKGLEFKGIQGAMPMYVHAEMLMYRADLYQTAGLQPPKTFEELKANAAKLHDPANETYGAVYRGIGPQALWPFSAWMWGYGGDWVDNELDPTTNSPETVAAFKIYGEILGKYGPPGPTDLDDGRMLSLFQEGKAAHYMAFAGYALQLADPATSKVVGKVGYAMYPGGPKGQFPIAIPTGIAISSKSQHKEAAWLFLQWATGKQMQKRVQVDTGVLMPRQSVWEDPDVAGDLDEKVPGWRDVMLQTLNLGKAGVLPVAEDVAAARDILGVVIKTSIQGGDVEAAASTATDKYKKLLQGVPKEELLPATATPSS